MKVGIDEKRRRTWVLAGALSMSLMLCGCSERAPTAPKVARPVKTIVLAADGQPRERSLPGRARASREADLAFQVPGLLANLPVIAGQRVAAGEVIAELRSDEYRARLTALQGQLAEARVALRAVREGERLEERLRLESRIRAAQAKADNAKAQFDRFARLVKVNAVALQEYEVVETNYRVAKEELEAAIQTRDMGLIGRSEDIEAREAEVTGLEGRVKEGEIQLADCTLRAPYDGVIAQRFVDANQSINARVPVIRFQAIDEIEVAVDVPESVMATDIRSSDPTQLVAEFAAVPGRQFPVQIREVAQVADPTTQTFNVRFALKTPPGVNLLPGMSATVRMRDAGVPGRGKGISVPISALYRESGGEQIVWLIGPDLVARRRPVKIGEARGDRIEVLEGLQPGDRIALAGVAFLSDGMKVSDLGNALGGTSK